MPDNITNQIHTGNSIKCNAHALKPIRDVDLYTISILLLMSEVEMCSLSEEQKVQATHTWLPFLFPSVSWMCLAPTAHMVVVSR